MSGSDHLDKGYVYEEIKPLHCEPVHIKSFLTICVGSKGLGVDSYLKVLQAFGDDDEVSSHGMVLYETKFKLYKIMRLPSEKIE